MIGKGKERISITIPKKMEKYLRKRAESRKISLSKIITLVIHQHYEEYEDDYPWLEIEEELENDKSKK